MECPCNCRFCAVNAAIATVTTIVETGAVAALVSSNAASVLDVTRGEMWTKVTG